MIRRLVKLTFRPDAVPHFLENFSTNKEAIRQFPGCRHLELWRQKAPEDHIFFTFSLWESSEQLEAYRASNLFREVWANTKIHFAERPEAWSVEVAARVPGEKPDRNPLP